MKYILRNYIDTNLILLCNCVWCVHMCIHSPMHACVEARNQHCLPLFLFTLFRVSLNEMEACCFGETDWPACPRDPSTFESSPSQHWN